MYQSGLDYHPDALPFLTRLNDQQQSFPTSPETAMLINSSLVGVVAHSFWRVDGIVGGERKPCLLLVVLEADYLRRWGHEISQNDREK